MEEELPINDAEIVMISVKSRLTVKKADRQTDKQTVDPSDRNLQEIKL